MNKSISTAFLKIAIITLLSMGAGCSNSPLETIQPPTQQTNSPAKMALPVTESPASVVTTTDLSATQTLVTNSNEENNTISTNTTTKLSAVREFLMGNSEDRKVFPTPKNYKGPGDIKKQYHLGIGPRIDFNKHSSNCTTTTTPDEFEIQYCLGQNLFTFEEESSTIHGTKATTHNLFLNGRKIVSHIYEDNNTEFLQDVRLVNNQLAFTFWQNEEGGGSNLEQTVSNIYYNGETFNEKYGAQGTHYLFAYQGKLGFVIKKNAKEYILFNNKIISPAYDQILTYGCCMNPHYLEVFKNGKVDFMAVKDEKDYLVEIDLKKYLP